MWLPVELTDAERESSQYLETLVKHITDYPHWMLVENHTEVQEAVPQDRDIVLGHVKTLLEYEIAFIGSRHGQPVGPFAGFMQAPDLGASRLEMLINIDPEIPSVKASTFLMNAMDGFLARLLGNQHSIQEVALPFPLPEGRAQGFVTDARSGRFYVKRR
jgi:hypothetical protein